MSLDNGKNGEGLIYGVWLESHSEARRGGVVALKRETGTPSLCDWGQRYEFQESGKLIDSYTAECGNDFSIHTWSGTWTLDGEQNLLVMRIDKVDFAGFMKASPCNPPEEYRQGRKYFIKELTEQKLVLSRNPA